MTDTLSIKAALARSERTLKLRPERGQRVYRNRAVALGGTECRVEEAGESLTVDVGKALGGRNAGPSPSMLLRSAMTSCVAIGITQWAARRDVALDRLEVALETDVDARGQFGLSRTASPSFEGIRLSVTVASPAPQAAVEAVIADSLRFSPLMDVFNNPQAIDCRVAHAPAKFEAETGSD